MIEQCALLTDGVPHRRVIGHRTEVTEVMTKESHHRPIDLPERLPALGIVPYPVRDQTDLRAGSGLPQHLRDGVGVDHG